MSDALAIDVKNVSKSYQIYEKPQDRLKQSFARGRKQYFREFHALSDVSFEVKPGETVGIIGRNGSGKSTLLQIICGTLHPTSGNVAVNGRIAALLELGAGFNPEFTGRENVYLNAAILGLSQAEIDEKYQSIVDFSEIGPFIDQPVKTYSSGMYVRLAFSVAISVEPDILVVDEALSVGDLNFRNKCMRRIQELRDNGVTIFFVSHDLGTVQTICDRAIWLKDGRIEMSGPSVSVCQEFHAHMSGHVDKQQVEDVIIQQMSDLAEFSKIKLKPPRGTPYSPHFDIKDPIEFELELTRKVELGKMVMAVSIYRDDKDWLIGQTSKDNSVIWEAGSGKVFGTLSLDPNILAPGNYLAAFAAYSEDLTICYALTDLVTPFSIRSEYPVWGKVIAPCTWKPRYE